MNKILVVFSILTLLILTSCCPEEQSRRQKRWNGDIVKFCSLGDKDGSSCVEYAVSSYQIWGSGSFINIKTPDGSKYDFNTSGWAIMIVNK